MYGVLEPLGEKEEFAREKGFVLDAPESLREISLKAKEK